MFKTDANNFTARAVNLFVHIDVSQHHQRMTCVKDHLNPSAGPLKVPLKAGSQNRAFSNFLSVPFLAKPVQIAPGLCQLFKNLSRLGISLCLPKSSSHHSLNPGPPRTHHHYIFTTWPPTYIVCLWFGLTSSRCKADLTEWTFPDVVLDLYILVLFDCR